MASCFTSLNLCFLTNKMQCQHYLPLRRFTEITHMKSLAQNLSYSKFSINVGCFHEELSMERNTNPEILESFLPQIRHGAAGSGV